MKILCLNRGSSSIKCSLYDFESFPDHFIPPIWEEKIESEKWVEWTKILVSKKFDVVGHRIVHGGKKYRNSTLIDTNVKDEIAKLSSLAPLHNLKDLEGIQILEKMFPNVPQIAVFDTSFHSSLPLDAAIYPGPYEWYENGIQKFGFHGISYQYCTKRAFTLLDKRIEKMVICHLGSGASLCAVQNGKSIDTTMGFTPLDGLMMDTRSGNIDPGILLYLLKSQSIETLTNDLYERSGLLGLSGISGDMRDIIESREQKAQLALDVYLHRLISMIGSMIASLKGIDALVFTGGIGENAHSIWERVCKSFSFLGMKLDKKKKEKEDCILSSADSKVQVLLIHTQEAFEMARECWKIQNERL